MGERIVKNEQVTEKMVQESLIKVRSNIKQWKNYLSENRDAEDPLVDFGKSVVEHGNNGVGIVEKRGALEISRELSAVLEFMGTLPAGLPLSETARILAGKYPVLPQLLGIIEFIPNRQGESLSRAGALIMNYQIDPHCYDGW